MGKLEKSGINQGERIRVRPFVGQVRSYSFVEFESTFEDISLAFDLIDSADNIDQEQYQHLIQKAIDACDGTMTKIVCSRTKQLSAETNNWKTWLKDLKKAFPGTFIYLLNTDEFGIWMGATPEILVKQDQEQFETVSLAGTRWDNEAFSEKEKIEQKVVTESILSALELSEDAVSSHGEINFGGIRHLRSIINWESKFSVAQIAEKLHPTPAVCGFPTDLAKAFISEHEGYDRKLYTGYVLIETKKHSNCAFVNLRCMQLFRKHIRLYAGGGINAMSDPKTEWIETEEKMQTMTDAIHLNA